MPSKWLVAGMSVLIALNAVAQEKAVDSRTKSVGLFKNGLAVVTKTVSLPEAGTYRVMQVPEPVHGTFWIESEAKLDVRFTTRDVEMPASAGGATSLQQDLAGRKVTVYFRDPQIPAATGTVLKNQPAKGEQAWERRYEQPEYYWWNSYQYAGGPRPAPEGRFLILDTDKGRLYVDASMVACARVEDGATTVTRRVPVMLLTVKEAQKKPIEVYITYLTKGMAWAPSYRVDLSDPAKLSIEQLAAIKNEMEDIRDAEMYLISGFPNVEFSHVTSPLSLRTAWTQFFQQLNTRPGIARGRGGAATQQVAMMNVAAPDMPLDLSALPTGEGPDVHYQPVGKMTLAEGDSLALSVASATAPYERIVEWIVPDTRTANGRYIEDYQRQEDPDKYQDAAWDAVRFKNPLAFPMTTGPATLMAGQRFLGQCMSYWTNAGEQASIRITKALSIRTRSIEQEEANEKREIVNWGGHEFRKVTVKGQLTASNHRKENVKLLIRRRFSGDLLEADGQRQCTLLEEGVYSVNKRNELNWTITLKPGEEQTLSYRYTVLVYH